LPFCHVTSGCWLFRRPARSSDAIPAQGQTFRPGIEVGGQAVIARLGSDDSPVSTGFSGRLTFDFSRWVALDGETEFAFDLGGVLEVYPTSRIVARFDLGDVMTTRNERTPQASTHNLTSRLGIGIRF
jgi:hypothetical protein